MFAYMSIEMVWKERLKASNKHTCLLWSVEGIGNWAKRQLRETGLPFTFCLVLLWEPRDCVTRSFLLFKKQTTEVSIEVVQGCDQNTEDGR